MGAVTALRVSPRSECSLPITTIVSVQFRPIMSMLMLATIWPTGTGGLAAKYAEPQSPFSSPLTVTKIIDRLGRAPGWA